MWTGPKGKQPGTAATAPRCGPTYFMLDGTPTPNLYGTNPASMARHRPGSGRRSGVSRHYQLVQRRIRHVDGKPDGDRQQEQDDRFHGTLFRILTRRAWTREILPTTLPTTACRNSSGTSLGGSIGGPFQKNKTFFFRTWESLHRAFGNNHHRPICRAPAAMVGGRAVVTVRPALNCTPTK